MYNYDMIYVSWVDSCAPAWGWNDLVDLDIHEYLIDSIGFLIEEDDDNLMLAMSFSQEDPNKLNAPFIIPKCCIKERYLLKKGNDKDCYAKKEKLKFESST